MEKATGIDVSHYKSRIDWLKVRQSGVQFTFIKATEADQFIDPRFDFNWTQTRRHRIIRGAYHFYRPLVDPVRQAGHFLRIAGQTLHATDLPPVVDIEMYPDFIRAEWLQIRLEERIWRVRAWLELVEKATGRIPIIYTNYYSWYELFANTDKFIRYPLWVAAYKVDQPKVPANNWGGKGWTFWQTSESGVVPGIRDEAPCVDLNYYAGTAQELNNWLNFTGTRPLPPAVTNGEMMSALVDTAEQIGLDSQTLVTQSGLDYLVDPVGNSVRPYDGPAVSELPLAADQKKALWEALDGLSGQNPAVWSITHQDLINAFYYAGELTGAGGWTLVERAGLDYIGKDRNQLYEGPAIDNLSGLTEAQKEAVKIYLGIILTDPEPLIENTPEPEVEEPEEELSLGTYGQAVDNQAVINAFYLTAIKLDRNGQEMMARAGLSHLVEDRLAVYTGPLLEVIPGLAAEERFSIAELMGIDLGDLIVDEIVTEPPVEIESEPEAPLAPPEILETPEVTQVPEPVEPPAPSEPAVPEIVLSEKPPYPGLINLDIINLFFRVAVELGENAWQWLFRLGLDFIGRDRESRFKIYQGPKFEDIPGLSEEQRAALKSALSDLS